MSIPSDDPEHPLPAPLATVPVQRHVNGATAPWVDDQVAAEVPVALVFNGISHAVMMATPQDLHELALGFALSEGILDRPGDCYGIELRTVAATACADAPMPVTTALNPSTPAIQAMLDQADLPAVEVHLEIASSAFARLKERRRSLAGRTGCGICGIDNLQALDLLPPHNPRPDWLAQLTPETLFRALAAMPAHQVLNQATGAVHAAGFARPDGTLVAVYEDVGRHNALDKLLGARALAQAGMAQAPSGTQPDDWARGFVIMSSRASYELVRKCARLQLPALATISAPTALAIQIAQAAGLQLWGLVRQPRAICYAA